MGCGKGSYVLVYHPILRVRISDFFGIGVVRNLGRKWVLQYVCDHTLHLRPRRDSLIGDDILFSSLTRLTLTCRHFRGPMVNSLPREF